jgi:hypothetical protein
VIWTVVPSGDGQRTPAPIETVRKRPDRARGNACTGPRNLLLSKRRLSPQLVERLVGIGYGLGVHVVGGSTASDFLPVGPGEHPLDREYLGGSQARLDTFAEGVRALTHRSEAGATLSAKIEVFTGDLTVPESLDRALNGAGAVFLVRAPPQTAGAVVERLAAHVRRAVFLSSPHQTPHPFFRQPNPMAVLHADIERLIAATGVESTIIRPGMFASNSPAWWAPAIRVGEVVRWPYGAAETAPVDDRDVAAVAARTLCCRAARGEGPVRSS